MVKEKLKQIWPEWEIEDPPLGKGSYGVVYKAVRRDHDVESFAAIKVISIPTDSAEIASLRSAFYVITDWLCGRFRGSFRSLCGTAE